MSKRISDAERVVQFFQTADESATAVMVQVIKGVIAGRNFQKEDKAEKKKREPKKPQLVPSAPAVEASSPEAGVTVLKPKSAAGAGAA